MLTNKFFCGASGSRWTVSSVELRAVFLYASFVSRFVDFNTGAVLKLYKKDRVGNHSIHFYQLISFYGRYLIWWGRGIVFAIVRRSGAWLALGSCGTVPAIPTGFMNCHDRRWCRFQRLLNELSILEQNHSLWKNDIHPYNSVISYHNIYLCFIAKSKLYKKLKKGKANST